MREGKAEVMLSNHVNAASLVHVGKVGAAQLDQKSVLQINTESTGLLDLSPEHRVRLRFFLDGQNEEVMPIV